MGSKTDSPRLGNIPTDGGVGGPYLHARLNQGRFFYTGKFAELAFGPIDPIDPKSNKKHLFDANDVITNAALAAAMQHHLHQLEQESQSLRQVIRIPGADENDNPEETKELLEGLDLLEGWLSDLTMGIVPLALAGAVGLVHLLNGTDKKMAKVHVAHLAFGSVSKAVAVTLSKTFLSLALHSAGAISGPGAPFIHFGCACFFAFSYAAFSTFFEYRLRYQYGGNKSMTFTNYLKKEQAEVGRSLITNFCAGFGMYFSALVPGLGLAENMAVAFGITGAATVIGNRAARYRSDGTMKLFGAPLVLFSASCGKVVDGAASAFSGTRQEQIDGGVPHHSHSISDSGVYRGSVYDSEASQSYDYDDGTHVHGTKYA
jgi:hypothetical protein